MMNFDNPNQRLWARLQRGDPEHFERVKRLMVRYPNVSLVALDIIALAETHPDSWCAEIAPVLRAVIESKQHEL